MCSFVPSTEVGFFRLWTLVSLLHKKACLSVEQECVSSCWEDVALCLATNADKYTYLSVYIYICVYYMHIHREGVYIYIYMYSFYASIVFELRDKSAKTCAVYA